MSRVEAEQIILALKERIEEATNNCKVEWGHGREKSGLIISPRSSLDPKIYFNLCSNLEVMDVGILNMFEINEIPLDVTYANEIIAALMNGKLRGKRQVFCKNTLSLSTQLTLSSGETLYFKSTTLLGMFFPLYCWADEIPITMTPFAVKCS